jgi:hypothetical protein
MTADPVLQIRYADVHRYAMFAKATYGDVASIRQAHGDSTVIKELMTSRVQLLVVNDATEAVQWIALRGTFNPTNVLVDGRVKVTHEPRLGAYFHSGFLRAAQEAYEAIEPVLDRKRELRLTGHSLGGAMAAILAALLAADRAGFNIGPTVTFGQPMVTDINGARILRQHALLRVVNRGDPVAMLPYILSRTHFEFPPTILFHHFGSQLTLYPDGYSRQLESRRLTNVVFGYKRLLVNHVLDLYLARLSALAGVR